MTKKSISDLIKLEKEIKAYGNGMFLTNTYPVSVSDGQTDICKHCGHGGFNKTKEEYHFELVLRDIDYKTVKHWFFDDDTYKSTAIMKEFTMAQVNECRKYWLKIRDKTLPEPVWTRW